MLVGLGIVLDLHERERLAVAILPLFQLQPAERLPHFAIADACDGPRSGSRSDACTATPRRRPPLPPPDARSRGQVRRICSTSWLARSSTSVRRSSAVAWTICTSVDQPQDCTPRKPLRNAVRSLPSSAARIAVTEAERARHRPVARLRRHVEHKRVGGIERDGAQQFHRRGPPASRIEPCRFASACARLTGAALSAPMPLHHEIAIGLDAPAGLLLPLQQAEILVGKAGKAVDLPAVEGHHQMPREALGHLDRADLVKPSSSRADASG